MVKPKIYCEKAERDPEGYIRCRHNGEYCGLVKYCRGNGWWEQIQAAEFCVYRKEKQDGKKVHPVT